jgi:hypothetical protein
VSPAETPLAMRHKDSAITGIRTTVGVAAGLIVSERDRDSPRFEPWKATPAFAEGLISAAEAAEVRPD